MIYEFIDFVENLFPNLNPYTKENLSKVLEKLENEGKKLSESNSIDCISNNSLSHLAQGDILENIPFLETDLSTGQVYVQRKIGILISNTCDIDRKHEDNNITICPLFRIEERNFNPQTLVEIKKNKVTDMLYIPDGLLLEYVVDFSRMNTLNKNTFIKQLNSGKVNKLHSLNSFGYYLLLAKLTIHFLRPEDLEVKENRLKNTTI